MFLRLAGPMAYVEAAAKAGYVSGIGGGKFGPTAGIKRQDLALLLVRVLGKSSAASSIKSSVAFANDEDKISSYAVGAVSIAVQPRVQVLTWDEDRNINPIKSATRADCAFAIYNTVNPVTNGKKTLTMAEENFPENLFPLISDSAYTMKAVTYLSSEPISMTPYGVLFPEMAKYVPTLANKHLIRNADGSIITDMELRPGMKWSDGQPVTIDDYIFSHQLYMSDDVQVVSRTPMDLVTKIVKVSDLKCRIYWKSWDPYIPNGWYIYPKHILGPQFTKDPKSINTSAFNNSPVYCGPYTVKTRVEGQYMTFAANKNWFGGQPVIENITMKAIDNNNTLLINMLTGQIDVSSESLSIDLARQFEAKMGKSFNVYYNKSTSAGILEWNLPPAGSRTSASVRPSITVSTARRSCSKPTSALTQYSLLCRRAPSISSLSLPSMLIARRRPMSFWTLPGGSGTPARPSALFPMGRRLS